MVPDLLAPFRGERYGASDRLSQLVAPPYDVIAPDQRPAYASRHEHNIVRLMLPEADGGMDKYRRAAHLLAAWRDAGVLVRDTDSAVYVMAQTFALPSGERRTRTGMFVAVAAEGYGPRRIRPHERTHRGPKADRLALLRATHTNLESIFLLAPDPDGALAAALQAVTAGPADATAALDGVEIALWVVTGDPSRLPLPPSPLYIADGHHRFETACAFVAEQGTAGRILAYVASARDAGLVALPTHRIVFGAGRGSVGRLVERWRQLFDVVPLPPAGDPLAALSAVAERTACAVLGADGEEFLLTLRHDADLAALERSEPDPTVRSLAVVRIEHLVVREVVGAAQSTVALDYTADAGKAIGIAREGRAAAVAVLVPPTRVDQILAVADAGAVMPPKSTYFMPKVPSGVVLLPLD